MFGVPTSDDAKYYSNAEPVDKRVSHSFEVQECPLFSGGHSSNNNATHALVFMLGGLTTHWKQTIAYEYTGNSYDAYDVDRNIQKIVVKCIAIGLTICAVVSDMKPQNQAVGRLNEIICSRHAKTVNFCSHPCLNVIQDKL